MSASDCLHNDYMTHPHGNDCMIDDMSDEISAAGAHRPQPAFKEPLAVRHSSQLLRQRWVSELRQHQHAASRTAHNPTDDSCTSSCTPHITAYTPAVHTVTQITGNTSPDNQHATPSELHANYGNDCLMTHHHLITQSACNHDGDYSPRLCASPTHSDSRM